MPLGGGDRSRNSSTGGVRRARVPSVPRVALYCGLSRFRNFALWSQRGTGLESEGRGSKRERG